MTGAPLNDAGLFLIRTLFGLFIIALLLRFLLQIAKADFYHPVSQFLFKVTQPIVAPLRKRIPSIGAIDSSVVLLLVLLQTVELALIGFIGGGLPAPQTILLLALAELLTLTLWIYILTLFALAILSWIQPGSYNPGTQLLHQLSGPLLRPIRRLVPPFQGIDFSVLAALILLQLARILLVGPLRQLAFAVG
ncbi:MAG: YggT family protein [Gammaproteobacteria bacterium]|nr:YggT family protein [Gammaproteobacteria bacterium]